MANALAGPFVGPATPVVIGERRRRLGLDVLRAHRESQTFGDPDRWRTPLRVAGRSGQFALGPHIPADGRLELVVCGSNCVDLTAQVHAIHTPLTLEC